jgi:hypothetical protein
MEVDARVVCQPCADDRVLAGPVVVHDEVRFLRRIHPGQPLEKPQELFAAMARVEAPGHLAGGHVESCEECRRAVTNIVVAAPFDLAGSHGQQRLVLSKAWILTLSSTQRTTSQRTTAFFGWTKVETNDVGDLVHEVGIWAELETVHEAADGDASKFAARCCD